MFSLAARGFTLIELLVTLAVVAICIGLVSTYAMPDERARLELETERLAQLLNLAASEARLTATPVGWAAGAEGYGFRRYTEQAGWSEVKDHTVLRARLLPPGIALSEVQVDGVRQQGRGRIVFDPYAPAPVFSIALSAGSLNYRVVGSAVGAVGVVDGRGATHGAFGAR
jgi:general secretion pathway protein H